MNKWQILKNLDKDFELILKEYPFKLQAIIWCYLKGYITTGGYGSDRFYSLDPEIKIVEVKDVQT